MTGFSHELKIAARGILARPAFSALVIGVLAAGLTCVIFMLAMINGFLLRPLPFAAPEQLLHAGVRNISGDENINPVSNTDLIEMRRYLASSADVGGVARSTINLSDQDRPQRVNGAFVSTNLFHVLGIAPMLGRDFSGDDEREGAPATAMLSYELWQSRYGGDAQIIGRQVRVNAQPAIVIGVMPQNFSYPSREVIWLAAALTEAAKPDDRAYWVILRRHADATDAGLSAALDNWLTQAAQREPERFRGLRTGIEPLAYMAVERSMRGMLQLMLGSVFVVLLLACANAANLLLTRTLSRRQEFALRVALGATRKRPIGHLLAESLLLSLLATVAALLLAQIGIGWQQRMLRAADFGPPLWLRFDLDSTVVLLALGAVLLTALASGLLPALRAAAAVASGLREGGRNVAGGSFGRISRILVIGEVALSCALLISVGTMLRGIVSIDHIDLGIDTDYLLSARIVLPENTYPNAAAQWQLYDKLAEHLRADAGVIDSSVGTALPGTWFNESHAVLPAENTASGDTVLAQASYGAVDDHFLAAYGIALQEGRFFDSRDRVDGDRTAVVDRRFVERFSSDQPILGRRFRLDPRDPNAATVTVVGVIGALTLYAPGDQPQPTLLIPLRQGPFRVASIAVRTRGDALAFAPRLDEIMRAIDPDTPVYWSRDYAAVIRSVSFGERIVAQSFGIFGVIALVLAGAGLYGVMAFSVGQRMREIGVRRALGASSPSVLRNLFGRSFVQLGIGLAIGLAGGIPFAHLLSESLHSIPASDAAVVSSALGILIFAAVLAVTIPARRALRIDPMIALRHD